MNLADLLVAIAGLGLLLSALVSALDQGQRTYAFGVARLEAQQGARVALDRLTHDLRRAGLGGVDFSALAVAEPTRVVLQLDENGDGTIAGRGETITWRLAGRVLRRDAGGGAQPIVNGVRDVTLRYFDGLGVETSTPAEVRSVEVEVTTEPDVRSSAAAVAVTVSTRVRLRNR